MAEKAYKRLFLRLLDAEMSDLLAKQGYRVARSKISNILEIRTYLNIKVFFETVLLCYLSFTDFRAIKLR